MEATQTAAPAASEVNTQPVDGKNVESKEVVEPQELEESYYDRVITKKVNGKEIKMPLRELLKKEQIYDASEESLAQAKAAKRDAIQARQQMQGLMQWAKGNPREFLSKSGVDPYDFAEATLTEKLEMLKMSPEGRRAKELEGELERERAEKKTLKDEKDQQFQTQQERETASKIDKELGDAFRASGLPKHKFYVQQVAAEMLASEHRRDLARQNEETPEEELSAEKAAAIVKNRFFSNLKEIIPGMELTQLKQLLGDDTLKKLREDAIQNVRNQDKSRLNSKPATPAAEKKSKKVFSSDHEYREWLESLKQ